ncbi:MAG: ATP-binding protein [Sulfurovum sp.]|nr:ATP-binding protein [Sulfurovum sp.]
MFVNRTKELELLNEEYHSDRFSFTVLYGRRRVGKTTLLYHKAHKHGI